RVILAAALDELGEAGYGAFSIESVAERAGVGKATIYRHWRHKLELIADAFRMLQDEGDPELVTGTPREKLERIVRHVAEVAKHSPFSKCLPALIDAELTAFSLLGAIFFCRLMTSKPFDPDRAGDLVDVVLGGRPRR